MNFTSGFRGHFVDAFSGLFPPDLCQELLDAHGPRKGGSPKLSPWQWLMGKVFHVMAGTGSFSNHVKQVTGISISDSALSQRGNSLGWQLVAAALRKILGPLAEEEKHPDAFHRGLRLIALDGTRFNLRNTGAMEAGAVKTRCSRGGGEPAFAHLSAVVLIELASHQPLAAACGWKNQGELTLARELLETSSLPPSSLLLGDRLFGTPSFIDEVLPQLEAGGGGFLMRVRGNLKSRVKETLEDGSRRVEVDVVESGGRKVARVLELREIHAEIGVEGEAESKPLRLWTSLLDAAEHPAAELVELYAQRWEHELFYRELKGHLHKQDSLLDGGTPESAAQEFMAMLMGAALVARQRISVAASAGVEIRRVSFAKVLETTVALCQVLAMGQDLIDDAGRMEWTRRVLEDLAQRALIAKRRPRSCPRGLRQPVKDWPKIRQAASKPLIKTITITNP